MEDEALGILQDFDHLRSFRFIQRGDAPRNLEYAYALQRRFKALRVERGEETIGFKVGWIFNNEGFQEAYHRDASGAWVSNISFTYP